MNIVKVISARFDSAGRLITKFLRNGKDDVSEAFTANPFGFDSNPVQGIRAVFTKTESTSDSVVVGFINLKQVTETGESRIFSTDADGALKIYVHLKADGTVHFGGDTGNLTRFQELESAFNQLRDDHNALITAFNSHVHATAATGPPVPPTPIPGSIPADPSTADVSGAKIEEFKTL